MKAQKVLIIGGTSGVGLATAKLLYETEFAASLFEVVIASRDQRKLDAAVSGLKGVKGQLADANSSESLRKLYTDIGDFDHLVLTLSGAKGAGRFQDLDLDELREGFDAKFWTQIAAAKEALPYIRKQGSITFVSAISARTANPGTSGLAAINGAIEAMIKPLAVELSPVRVNAVSPGVVDTPWWDQLPAGQKEAIFQQAAAATLVGRIGQPENLAQVIEMLIKNPFMTGTVIECDGGLRLKAGG